ncbi:hypothetical protein CACET_c14440 [Clostridium aceticum]|uniref:Uncharacterized protein n=1 Tax=Clostridium aceticum TaxID=84022 RepID=A0A0D8IC14_9CLOT|nr:hypothetical protein [Clostridium aceticum]AKL94908.1 hypothetical protein CACET_c14440 [Clostridium aceticum]KJF27830.1 hypothetical protein TZ02_04320 [Clostridium aceticum]
MKKIVVLFFFVVLLIGHENFIFASYESQEVSEEEIQQHLQEIFDERIDVWNDFMVGKYSSLEAIRRDLEDYTTEPLLAIDISTYESIMNHPSSYEIIKEVNVMHCETIKANGTKGTYLVRIFWGIQSYDEFTYEEVEYIVEMLHIKNKWMLSDYQLNIEPL